MKTLYSKQIGSNIVHLVEGNQDIVKIVAVMIEDKEGLTDFPILYPNTDLVAYDHPERYTKTAKKQAMYQLRVAAAINFARKYTGWHAWSKDLYTQRVIKLAEVLGLVELNEFTQFRSVRYV